MTTAIYVRVSTDRQALTHTIDQQIQRLRAHLKGEGQELRCEQIFRDDGYSGATLNCPGLDRLRDQLREVPHPPCAACESRSPCPVVYSNSADNSVDPKTR